MKIFLYLNKDRRLRVECTNKD